MVFILRLRPLSRCGFPVHLPGGTIIRAVLPPPPPTLLCFRTPLWRRQSSPFFSLPAFASPRSLGLLPRCFSIALAWFCFSFLASFLVSSRVFPRSLPLLPFFYPLAVLSLPSLPLALPPPYAVARFASSPLCRSPLFPALAACAYRGVRTRGRVFLGLAVFSASPVANPAA